MPPIRYTLHIIEPDGTRSTVPRSLTSRDVAHVADTACSFRGGVVRWAIEDGTWRFLAGFDARGHEIHAAPTGGPW